MLLVNMENKQTAVEWFIDNLKPLYPNIEEFKLIIGLAKDMEKEQEFETKAYWFGRGILASKENRVDELKPKK